jgi:transposase-like protein
MRNIEALTWSERGELIKEREAGGETIKLFCLRQGISSATYYRWLKLLRNKPKQKLKFVEITPALMLGSALMVESAGVKVHVPDIRLLREVLETLRYVNS